MRHMQLRKCCACVRHHTCVYTIAPPPAEPGAHLPGGSGIFSGIPHGDQLHPRHHQEARQVGGVGGRGLASTSSEVYVWDMSISSLLVRHVPRSTEGLDGWGFTTAKFWGESPLGVWTISITDHLEGGHQIGIKNHLIPNDAPLSFRLPLSFCSHEALRRTDPMAADTLRLRAD